MTDEELRQALADALPHEDWCHARDRSPEFPCPCADVRWERAEHLPAVAKRYAILVTASTTMKGHH